MIVFQTNHQKLYNYIINQFLKKEIFNDDTDVGDMIEFLVPKYLYREQYSKCVKTFEELFFWTKDEFYHSMSAFHELVLYYFIIYMADLRNDMDRFDYIYLNKKSRSLIRACVKTP